MATMQTAAYSELTAPGIEMWMDEEAKLHKPMFTQIFSLENTSRLYEDDSSKAGIDYPEVVGEAAASPEDEFLVGYSWRYEQKVYKRKISISKLMQQTDLYGKMKADSKELSTKAAQNRDIRAFGIFRNAFNSAVTYGDGKQLISVAHPRKDGGAAQRNTFLDGVQRVLTYDNLKLLEDVLMEVVSNKGIPIHVGLDSNLLLMVAPYNRETALQIAQADGTPGTADNSVNYWKGRNMDVLVCPYISWRFAYKMGDTTSTDREAWDKRYFLLDPSYSKKFLKFKQIQDFSVNAWEDDDTDVWYAKVRDVFAVGISGWFGIAGSAGDGTTETD
jgi:hypothetical protein